MEIVTTTLGGQTKDDSGLASGDARLNPRGFKTLLFPALFPRSHLSHLPLVDSVASSSHVKTGRFLVFLTFALHYCCIWPFQLHSTYPSAFTCSNLYTFKVSNTLPFCLNPTACARNSSISLVLVAIKSSVTWPIDLSQSHNLAPPSVRLSCPPYMLTRPRS